MTDGVVFKIELTLIGTARSIADVNDTAAIEAAWAALEDADGVEVRESTVEVAQARMIRLTGEEAKDALAALGAVSDQIDAAVRDRLMKAPFDSLMREAHDLGLSFPGIGAPNKRDLVTAIIARIEANIREEREG